MESNKSHDKDNNLVLVGVPLEIEDVSTAVKKVIRDNHLVDSVVIDSFRHLNKENKPSGIVKVKLKSAKDKPLLKKILGSTKELCKFARDDLTPIELSYDRMLRNFCHEKNKEIGKKVFVVRNLAPVELKAINPHKPTPSIPAGSVTTRKTRKPIDSASIGTQ